MSLYCKFPAECDSERILKIGLFWQSYVQEFGVLFFMDHSVVQQLSLTLCILGAKA